MLRWPREDPPSAIDDRSWERLRYRGAPVKQRVLADLPGDAAPLAGDRVWQSFKQHCAAEGNLVPQLISQLEPQDPDPGMFQRRGPRGVIPSGTSRRSNVCRRGRPVMPRASRRMGRIAGKTLQSRRARLGCKSLAGHVLGERRRDYKRSLKRGYN
jgi:hypothetical protein